MNEPRRIGLFGGTFDPVHLGHIHLAGIARGAMRLDEVKFIPCRISPHKTGTCPASGGDRVKMLEIATAGLPWAVVDDFELAAGGESFSYLTAMEMARRHPSARLFWIMGGDQWDALPLWTHPEKVAALCEFIVLSRGGVPGPRDGWRMHVVADSHPASSTAIREALRRGEAAPDGLDPEVARWILERGIYRAD
jgi:nicotinate-nucleotide adenylyltransferase